MAKCHVWPSDRFSPGKYGVLSPGHGPFGHLRCARPGSPRQEDSGTRDLLFRLARGLHLVLLGESTALPFSHISKGANQCVSIEILEAHSKQQSLAWPSQLTCWRCRTERFPRPSIVL